MADDPLAALGVGLAADHKAKRGRKPKAEEAGDKAAQEATDAGSPPDEAAALGQVVEEKVDQALATTDPVPPAPGDDAESVFDRRIDRLFRMVAEADFEAGTAVGDTTDILLELFKSRPKLWPAMSNDEQKQTIRAVQQVAADVVRRVVIVVAEQDSQTIQATLLPQFAVKGEAVEAKLKIEHVDEDGLIDLYRLAGARVVVISANDKRFAGTRKEPVAEPDQIGMTFADDKPKEAPAPEHPDDDSDLADGADDDDDAHNAEIEGREVERPATDEGPFVVYDEAGEVWLAPEDAADRWTDDKAQARQFVYENDAHNMLETLDEGGGTIGVFALSDFPKG